MLIGFKDAVHLLLPRYKRAPERGEKMLESGPDLEMKSTFFSPEKINVIEIKVSQTSGLGIL